MTRQNIVVKDRSQKIWYVHLTTGCDGDINVVITERPRQRYGKIIGFWQFVKWAKAKRIRGLPYEELFGPTAIRYGRAPLFGMEQSAEWVERRRARRLKK